MARKKRADAGSQGAIPAAESPVRAAGAVGTSKLAAHDEDIEERPTAISNGTAASELTPLDETPSPASSSGDTSPGEPEKCSDAMLSAGSQQSAAAGGGSKYNLPPGLSKSQKKNLIHKLREKEKKAKDKADQELFALPDDPLDSERQSVLKSLQSRFDALPRLAQLKATDVLLHYDKQASLLNELDAAVASAVQTLQAKLKKPDRARQTSQQLLEQLKDAEKAEERDEHMLSWISGQLALTVSWENLKKFQGAANELRKKIQDTLKVNEKAFHAAKEWDRRRQVVDRLKVLKQKKSLENDELEIDFNSVVSVHCDVSAEATGVLFQPLNIFRKVERHYSVIIDRSTDRARSRSCTVSGLEEDVNAAVTFLRLADFTGRVRVPVDNRVMPALIGRGGSGILAVEEKYHCFLQTETSEVIIYGLKDDVQNVIAHIQQLKTEQDEMQQTGEVPLPFYSLGRMLVSPKYLPDILAIQSKFNVIINCGARRGARGDDQSAAAAVIRGKPENIEKAKAPLAAIIARFGVETFPTTPAVLQKLFAPPQQLMGGGDANLAREQFQQLRESTNVTFSRASTDDSASIVAVGEKKELEELKPKIEDILRKAAFVSKRIFILREQRRCLGDENKAYVELQSGASLSFGRMVRDEVPVEILGNDEQKAAAEELILEILEREGVVESLQLHADETIAKLLRDRGQRINELQEAFGAQISLNRDTKMVKLVGSRVSVEESKEALSKMDEDISAYNANMIARSIPVEQHHIRAIIGRKGANITNIRTKSGVDRIDINDKDLKVTIRGTEENVLKAEKMIQETITAGSNNAPGANAETFTVDRTPASETRTAAMSGSGSRALAKQNYVGGQHASQQQHPVKVDDSSFPVLGAAPPAVQKRPHYRKKRNGNATPNAEGSGCPTFDSTTTTEEVSMNDGVE